MTTRTTLLRARNRALLITREQAVLLGIWSVAVLGCMLGLAFRPSGGTNPGVAQQLLDLVRLIATAAIAVVLVFGPGIVLRARYEWSRVDLAFVPLPGLAALLIIGAVAWTLGTAGIPHPVIVSVLMAAPLLAWMPVAILGVEDRQFLTPEEARVLLIVAAALGLAIARSLWSLGPSGELWGGTVSRTLEVGDRSDPDISFHVVQLVAQAKSPFGPLAHSYFLPYTFSDRGPLAGLASAPVVLLSGSRPPAALGAAPWSPFDPLGFMSYRLAMMTLASTAFVSVWSLTRVLAGAKAARFALLLAATTPFLVHEIWFTWPKLIAASLVLMAAISLVRGRALAAGLLVGLGYLFHPVALLFLPALALLALWPLVGATLRRPRVGAALRVIAGVAVSVIAWRLFNGSQYTQSAFVNYLTQAGRTKAFLAGHPAPVTISAWASDRLVSLGNTLVPLRLFFLSANDQSINTAYQACFPLCSGGSPAVIHFFFQYWTAVPFGLGILFFPLLLQSLWRAFRAWPWAVTAAVVVPFVAFTIYWGDASTGMLREGLQAWVLTLLVVVAAEQKREEFRWLRINSVRAVLALRAVEVPLVAMLSTVVTTHRVIAGRFWVSDAVAVAAMVGFAGYLGMSVWRGPAGRSTRRDAQETSSAKRLSGPSRRSARALS